MHHIFLLLIEVVVVAVAGPSSLPGWRERFTRGESPTSTVLRRKEPGSSSRISGRRRRRRRRRR